MIIGLALLATVALLMTLLARSALLTTDKARALSLADASAKSVATWYAQILNYDAYTNRAIAANEIMIAQSVTMVAWTDYVKHLATNIGSVAQLLPAVQPIATWIHEASVLAHESASVAAQLEVPLRSSYTRALQASQQLMHASATPFAAQALVNEVVWTGDRRFFAQIIPSSNISAFTGFSRQYSGAARTDLAALVRMSQDSFSHSRGYDQRLYLMPTVTCIPNSVDRSFSKLIRRGMTWLSDDMEEIQSADTLSIHTWRRRGRWNPTCRSLSESIPLGWGAAEAALDRDTLSNEGTQQEMGPAFLTINSRALSLAQSSKTQHTGYLGLSSHRELSALTQEARRDAAIRVPVLVRLPSSKLPKIAAHQTDPATRQQGVIRNALWSLAVAETFFHRPAVTMPNSADREFANLFAPFWSSRLVSPSAADRAVAMAMSERGVSP